MATDKPINYYLNIDYIDINDQAFTNSLGTMNKLGINWFSVAYEN